MKIYSLCVDQQFLMGLSVQSVSTRLAYTIGLQTDGGTMCVMLPWILLVCDALIWVSQEELIQ